MGYIDLADKMQTHNIQFMLFPYAWERFRWPRTIPPRKRRWQEIKYVEHDGSISRNINLVPNTKGGIYIFVIKSPVLPQISEYLVYIGRARHTRNHSLRVRVKKYLNEYLQENNRPKVVNMMAKWKDHLYLKFLELDDNVTISELESRLINSIMPPFNDEIPDKKFRKSRKAF